MTQQATCFWSSDRSPGVLTFVAGATCTGAFTVAVDVMACLTKTGSNTYTHERRAYRAGTNILAGGSLLVSFTAGDIDCYSIASPSAVAVCGGPTCPPYPFQQYNYTPCPP